MTKQSNESYVRFQIPRSLRDALHAEARRRMCSASALARLAIARELGLFEDQPEARRTNGERLNPGEGGGAR